MKDLIRAIDQRVSRAQVGVRQAFRAVISRINTSPGLALVQAQGLAGESIQAAEMAQHFGFTSHPPAGSMGVVLPIGGKSAHGIVIATEHASYRIAALNEGEVAIYTSEGDTILMKNGHAVQINTQTLTINASTQVIVNSPLLKVSGGDVQADSISLKNHKHGSVQSGSSQTGVAI